MKLTRSHLRQLIREVIQKEGIGDWLDRMRASEESSGAAYREKLAAHEKEKEERKKGKKKSFFGSEFGSGLEKALREEEEEMSEAKKRNRPAEFKSGDKVTHEEYGTGTVTHPGASTDATGGREVSVKWDDPDIGSRRAIEANLKKK